MNRLKKLTRPFGLMVVFLILVAAWGFSATNTTNTSTSNPQPQPAPITTKPQPAPVIIKPQPAPKAQPATQQPAPKEKPASQPATKEKAAPGVDPAVTYKKTCGECHMAFPPEFLPSTSWEKLMGSLEKHFEGSVEMDNKTKEIILPYLKGKGAEFSKAKISQKIMQSLEGQTPLRITEVPYIIKKHRKYTEDFKRKPIGSFSNCGACHMLADEWNFGRRIMIPREES